MCFFSEVCHFSHGVELINLNFLILCIQHDRRHGSWWYPCSRRRWYSSREVPYPLTSSPSAVEASQSANTYTSFIWNCRVQTFETILGQHVIVNHLDQISITEVEQLINRESAVPYTRQHITSILEVNNCWIDLTFWYEKKIICFSEIYCTAWFWYKTFYILRNMVLFLRECKTPTE